MTCSSTISNICSFFGEKVYFPYRFKAYNKEGPSPLQAVETFPENIPVVFITSKADGIVPCENTEKIAKALEKKQKNDAYLLKLEKANHADFMFHNKEDPEIYLIEFTMHFFN